MPAMAIDWSQCPDVEQVPGRCSGQPVVKGTRILVQGILDNFDGDQTPEEIAGPDIYPDLPVATVRRVLHFALSAQLRAMLAARCNRPLSRDEQFRLDIMTRQLAEIDAALRRRRR